MGDAVKEEIKEAIKAYDKIASLYASYKSEKLLQYQLNKFISLLKGKKILDAGCGTGRDVDYFNEEGVEAVGIDISKGMLEEAKKRVPGGKFIHMDFSKTKFPDNSFHGIWCMASLGDVTKDDISKVLKEFNRLLDKQGILYTAVKHGKGQEVVKKRKYNDLPRLYVYYEKAELEDFLKKAGFSIINSIVSEDEGREWLEIFAKKI
ncbi:MAG TPA: class I SAM-dependent methyltransferase [Candidatus Nanoarchaeia archaeon]|nr:class I SAM-dependent methyltransferase [Candidatus Nanoarchaeia archaeon]